MNTIVSSLEILESRIAPSVFIVTSLADNPGAGTLRGALDMANAHAGPDTIVFHLPAPPAHTENIIKLTGPLFNKGNVTIIGPSAGKLIIDGDNKGRVFHFDDNDPNADSPVTISGLSIVNGNDPGLGGGIYSAESLTLKNVIISGNTAQNGGGVVVYDRNGTEGAKAVISNSLIIGNSASHSAGGLDLGGLKSVTITKTVVTGNSAVNNAGGIAAGVTSAGTGIAITGCVVSGNSAGYGGGLFLNDANLSLISKITISGTKITGNTGTDKGGGLLIYAGNAFIAGSTISNNTAGNDGGGIAAKGFHVLTISGSSITGNQVTNPTMGYHGGGGVSVDGGGTGTLLPVKITGSHLTDNHSANDGGGLLAYGGVALTVSGSTFSRNYAINSGGGISTGGLGVNKVNLIVSGGVFSDNFANDGGGIDAFSNGDFSITGSKVTGNIATDVGGGILAYGEASPIVKNVVATGNFASDAGGGLFVRDASNFQISGGSFTGNGAKYGGGIFAFDAGGSIQGVTISGNAATGAGGGVFNGGIAPGTVTIQLAKVFANSAPVDPDVSPIPL